MLMFLFANIYEAVVSDSTKMLDGFTPAKADKNAVLGGYCLGEKRLLAPR